MSYAELPAWIRDNRIIEGLSDAEVRDGARAMRERDRELSDALWSELRA